MAASCLRLQSTPVRTVEPSEADVHRSAWDGRRRAGVPKGIAFGNIRGVRET